MLPGFISDLGIFVNNQPPYGDISFISTGTYIFTVPDNVNSISVVLVGGGGQQGQFYGGTGAGNYGATAGGWGGGGGGGDAYGGGGGGGGYQGGNGGGDPSSGTGGYSYITTLANPSATYHGNTGTGYVEILTL